MIYLCHNVCHWKEEIAEEQAVANKSAAVLMSDLINAGVVKQNGQNSFIVHGHDGELNFDYN